jgi:hypothetical protein
LQGEDRVGQLADMILEGRIHGVEPMAAADKIFEVLRWDHVLDAEWDNRDAFVHGALDLPHHLRRTVGVPGENHDHDRAFADRFHNGRTPGAPSPDIARGDPAPDFVGLERAADSVGDLFVFRAIADERVVRHWPRS